MSHRPTRLVTTGDAPALVDLVRASRDYLAPWEPTRPEQYFTTHGQRAVIEDVLAQHVEGRTLPHVILGVSGEVAGRITLSGIVRGAFQSCSVGYWVSRHHAGRGLATAALGDITRAAFDELGLHRVEVGVMPRNLASRRVVERNGFTRFGLAPTYLNIAGRWEDHLLYQRVRSGASASARTSAPG